MSLPINDLPYHNSNSSDSNATGPKSEPSTGNFNCFTEQKPEIRNQNQKNNFGNNLNQNSHSHSNSAATSHIVQAASKPSIISRSHVIQPQQHHTRFAEAANSLNKSKHMRLFSRYILLTQGPSIKDLEIFLAIFDTPLTHVGISTLIFRTPTLQHRNLRPHFPLKYSDVFYGWPLT